MKIEARFTHDKVRFDQENNVHLVLSLKAPKLDWEAKRPPVCIIPIIDVSTSMSGDKLDYAKKTLLKLIDHLKPGDYCGLGAFSTSVYAIQPPIEMTQASKDALKTKVGELSVVSSTNFSSGLELGLKWGQIDVRGDMLVRVILLTDGQANQGVTDRAGLLQIVGTRGRATVSCFGYGTDADQELLADVAKRGEGNYAFIKDPEQALTAFGKELGGLLSTYAQNIVFDLAPHNGHKIEEVVSDVDAEEKDNKVVIKLGDILSEEERHVVLALKLSAQTQALPRDMNIVDVRVEYDLLDQGKRTHRQEELKAKLRFVKAGEEQEKPTPEVDQIVGLAQLSKAQVDAEDHAKLGDFQGAQVAMQMMQAVFQARGLGGLAQLAGGIRSKLTSHVAYAGGQGYLRSSKGFADRAYAVSQMDDELEGEVKCSGLDANFSLGNAAQEATAGSFADGASSFAGGSHPAVSVAPVVVPTVKPKLKKGVAKSKSRRW